MFHLRRSIYWDNNATTSVAPEVVRTMTRVLKSVHGNPSSPHRVAHDAALVLDDSRRTLAQVLKVAPSTIHFTGSATEAANQILESIAHESGRPPRIVTSPIEHPSVLRTLQKLAGEGMEVDTLAVDADGRVVLESLEHALETPTALVCCMMANNETGVIQDIAAVSKIVHERGSRLFVDCVQALGKIPFDLATLGVDYANVSAHKIHGPKGNGLLYARESAPLQPFVHGGHQEEGRRAGTEALHDIAGFAEAARAVPTHLANAHRVDKIRQEFATGLRALRPDATFATPNTNRLPTTLSVRFPGTPNTVLLGWLDLHGIAASAGSACNTGSNEPSHVLTALGLSADASRETLRFSLDVAGDPARLAKESRRILEVLADYFEGRVPSVQMLIPATLEPLLADPRTLVVDARHGYDRRLVASIHGSREIDWPFARHLSSLPRERSLVVVCQVGFDAPLLAWKLHGMGFPHVGFLAGGMLSWKASGR